VIQDLELHGGIDDVVSVHERRPWLDLVKEVGVVADLLELHQNIQKLNSVLPSDSIYLVDVASYNSFIKLFLKLSHAKEQINFFLGLEFFLHVNLEPPEHEWLKQPVNLLDHYFLLVGIVFLGVLDYEQVVEIFN